MYTEHDWNEATFFESRSKLIDKQVVEGTTEWVKVLSKTQFCFGLKSWSCASHYSLPDFARIHTYLAVSCIRTTAERTNTPTHTFQYTKAELF